MIKMNKRGNTKTTKNTASNGNNCGILLSFVYKYFHNIYGKTTIYITTFDVLYSNSVCHKQGNRNKLESER